jgi:hypothetical protein
LTPHHHNYFFGRGTLTRILRDTGFEVLRSAHDPAWYSAKHLAYKLESLLPRGIARAASHRVRRTWLDFEVPVNLFDIVTVVARKRP